MKRPSCCAPSHSGWSRWTLIQIAMGMTQRSRSLNIFIDDKLNFLTIPTNISFIPSTEPLSVRSILQSMLLSSPFAHFWCVANFTLMHELHLVRCWNSYQHLAHLCRSMMIKWLQSSEKNRLIGFKSVWNAFQSHQHYNIVEIASSRSNKTSYAGIFVA